MVGQRIFQVRKQLLGDFDGLGVPAEVFKTMRALRGGCCPRGEELLRLEIADFSLTKKDDWIPPECLNPPSQRVRLNVGGQV